MSTFTDLVIFSLATHRGTRLVIEDEITADLREKAFEQVDKIPNENLRNKLSYLLTCPWCVSFHVAAALLLLKQISPDAYKYLTLSLAASSVTGIAYSKI